VGQTHASELELRDIQGDVLIGLQKQAELFLFFKIVDIAGFKAHLRQHVTSELTSAARAHERERLVYDRQQRREPPSEAWLGLNLGFTPEGMTQLLGAQRPPLEPAFERGADSPATIALLCDPPLERWLPDYRSDRIDGVFLITGPNAYSVRHRGDSLRQRLVPAIKTIYSEIGTARPGRERGREHFGFYDGISQPAIRGLALRSRPAAAPDQGLPGQDLVWPGEFVLGYPTQNPKDPRDPGPISPLPAPWARNGSYMVFRRLEQMVPEFRSFVAAQAARLGSQPELLASRMVGRWPSGAPMELAPRQDNPALGDDEKRNNDFGFAGDPFQRGCPYAAHIRKVNPRDDAPGGGAETLTHRIMRAGIPFGPEVKPGEVRTMHSRGLMFVCYQASIERQFEWIQAQFANNPGFIAGKKRPNSGSPVTPGFDPIIGQAPGGGARAMDEPAPNYPTGNRRTSLEMPEQFVKLTAAAYFFMPSLSALRTVLTH
jgi:Dyp-type peroxidase family